MIDEPIKPEIAERAWIVCVAIVVVIGVVVVERYLDERRARGVGVLPQIVTEPITNGK